MTVIARCEHRLAMVPRLCGHGLNSRVSIILTRLIQNKTETAGVRTPSKRIQDEKVKDHQAQQGAIRPTIPRRARRDRGGGLRDSGARPVGPRWVLGPDFTHAPWQISSESEVS